MQVRALPSPVVPLFLSFAVVVVVWSTTPLFLYLSTRAFPAELAGGLRMAVAAVLATVLLRVTGARLRLDALALQTYAAMTPGVFGAMYLSYLAAPRVPSGLISVLFGLSPVVSALCARLLRTDPLPAAGRLAAALLALAGLVLISRESGGGAAHLDAGGLALLLVAVLLFSLSGVLVRKLGAGIDALVQTTGALWMSLPFYFGAWLLAGAPPPDTGNVHFGMAVLAIGYLAVFGSVLGFACYYQVLKQMPAASASLITVITPVFALALGAWLNDERLTAAMLSGALLVLAGVAGFLLPASGLRTLQRSLSRLRGRRGTALTADDK